MSAAEALKAARAAGIQLGIDGDDLMRGHPPIAPRSLKAASQDTAQPPS